MVDSPHPIFLAARATILEAPAISPPTTKTCPLSNLLISISNFGRYLKILAEFKKISGLIFLGIFKFNLMIFFSPQNFLPGIKKCAGLKKPIHKVISAFTAQPKILPVSHSIPLGISIEIIVLLDKLIASIIFL